MVASSLYDLRNLTVSNSDRGKSSLWESRLGVYLDICFSLGHRSKVLQDLVTEADLEVLEPDAGLLVHVVVQLLQPRQLAAVLHLEESPFAT